MCSVKSTPRERKAQRRASFSQHLRAHLGVRPTGTAGGKRATAVQPLESVKPSHAAEWLADRLPGPQHTFLAAARWLTPKKALHTPG